MLSELLLYEFYYNSLEPYWHDRVHSHYINTDIFVLSFDANNQDLTNFLQQNKDELEFSELYKSHEIYDTINKKVVGR